jgi:hypothetical protein
VWQSLLEVSGDTNLFSVWHGWTDHW